MRLRSSIHFIPIVIPLIAIAISIATAEAWNFVEYALSDLGNPNRGLTAIIFNSGLAIGGYLIGLQIVSISRYLRKMETIVLLISMMFLVLIGVLDISYGIPHLVVSIAFFISIAIYVLYNAYTHRSLVLFIGFIVALAIWITHFIYDVPPGVAIPETVSVLIACYTYITKTLKKCVDRLSQNNRYTSTAP